MTDDGNNFLRTCHNNNSSSKSNSNRNSKSNSNSNNSKNKDSDDDDDDDDEEGNYDNTILLESPHTKKVTIKTSQARFMSSKYHDKFFHQKIKEKHRKGNTLSGIVRTPRLLPGLPYLWGTTDLLASQRYPQEKGLVVWGLHFWCAYVGNAAKRSEKEI